MAIAFDAFSDSGLFNSETTKSWTHTPVGTPKGIFLFFVVASSNATKTSSVTYGGVAMTLINTGRDSAGEFGYCEGYFLGSSIPTGAQTVTMNFSSANDTGEACVISVTAGGDTQLAGTGSGKVEGDTADPSVTITGITGASYGAAGTFSGFNATSSMTAGTGQTMRLSSDFGSTTAFYESSTSENASGDITIAFNSSAVSDDVGMVAIAIEQAPPPTTIATYDGAPYSSTVATINGAPRATIATVDGAT